MQVKGADVVATARRAAAIAETIQEPRARELCLGAVFGFATESASEREVEPLLEVFRMAMSRLAERLEARGKAEGKADALLLVLHGRFGRLPAALEDRVGTERRVEALDRWLVLAGEAATLAAFVAGVGE